MTTGFIASQSVTFLTALALVTTLGMLAFRNVNLLLRAYGAQSMLLGLAAAVISLSPGRHHVLPVALITIAVKGLWIPYYLQKVISNIRMKRELDPAVSYQVSVLCGVGLVLLSYAAVEPFAAIDGFAARGFGLALAIMQLGLWLMVGRRKAMTQAIGLLVVENGLLAAAISTGFGMPMVVELGLAFDLLVAVVIIGMLIIRIRTAFSSMDTEHLNRLRG